MGIDAAAIFDCRLTREEMLDFAVKLELQHAEFGRLFAAGTLQGRTWEIAVDDEDGEIIEISGGGPFGLWREEGGLLCLWNTSRWKFILQHEHGHYREFIASTRLVGKLAAASRVLYLSDYTLASVDTSRPFDEIQQSLGTPADLTIVHDIVDGYPHIFFYEKLGQ